MKRRDRTKQTVLVLDSDAVVEAGCHAKIPFRQKY